MFIALPVLPLLALAGHVTIDDVSAGAAGNKVTVEVTTSSPVETGDVRSKFANGVMQLYLDGGHVGAKKAIKSGGFGISVLKRAEYAKVEIPMAADLGCVGPVAVTAGESGFQATLNCQGASPAATEEPAVEEKPTAVAKTAAPEKTVEKTAAPASPSPSPSPSPKTETAKLEAKPEPTTAATPDPTAELRKTAELLKTAAPASPPITTASMPKSSSSSTMMMPAMALIVIGGAAWFLKKRQGKKTSMIEILETAQLGPKRQLVVARVNGETMILGSSEAGITCLSGLHRLPPMGSEGTMSSIFQVSAMQAAQMNQMNQMGQMNQPQPPPLPNASQFPQFEPPQAPKGPIAEFTDEGGILTRLFRARGQDRPQEKFDNIELHEFDNLLQESVADQELRRKLSSGFRGKVS